MNWFMWVWIGGIVGYLITNILIAVAVKCKMKAKIVAPENWGYSLVTLFRGLITGCIPFVNILITLLLLSTLEQTMKKTEEEIRARRAKETRE